MNVRRVGEWLSSALVVLPMVGSPILWSAEVQFVKRQLDAEFRSEGVAVGDFNKDGQTDIAAGFVWYEAPAWKLHVIAPEPPSARGAVLGSPLRFDPVGYSNSFCNFAEDLNGDGWTDLIVVDFPGTPTWWFENPKGVERPWECHLLTPVTNNESPDYLDVDGDGRRELVAAFSPDPQQSDGPDRRMAVITRQDDPLAEWTVRPISAKAAPGTRRYSHGLGVGDINGDGKADVLTADGWWQSPGNLASGGEWAFQAAPWGEPGGERRAAHLYAFDIDGDGDADVTSSSPHGFGIWWHEQLPGGEWKTHEIDMSISQNHAVCLADINGDGLLDFVTGKRWWAHAKGDPGGDQPAAFCWYELKRQDKQVSWTRHQFDDNSGPGTQFQVADVNGDGLLDIVTSNKKGVHLFQQTRVGQ